MMAPVSRVISFWAFVEAVSPFTAGSVYVTSLIILNNFVFCLLTTIPGWQWSSNYSMPQNLLESLLIYRLLSPLPIVRLLSPLSVCYFWFSMSGIGAELLATNFLIILILLVQGIHWKPLLQKRRLQSFSVRFQKVNILDFLGYIVSVAHTCSSLWL